MTQPTQTALRWWRSARKAPFLPARYYLDAHGCRADGAIVAQVAAWADFESPEAAEAALVAMCALLEKGGRP